MARIIDTRLEANALNREALESVIRQISDGIWENSAACTSYWVCCDVEVSDHGTLQLSIDSRSCLYFCDSYIVNRYFKMTDAKVLQFFARKLAQIVSIEGKDTYSSSSYALKADNNQALAYLGCREEVRVSDVYKIRKALLKTAKEIA